MHVLHEEPPETIHLFVVPEEQLPRKPDYPSILMASIACLCLLAVITISVFSAAPQQEVSFTVSVPAFHLAPASKTQKTIAIATGKGHTQATYATGIITFYNGLPYTQIIPGGTTLKGADGVSVITDQQAVIPPVANTIPPTDGHTNVLAHSLIAGENGNIQAGDINEACCVTSVIAQNPSTFTGGKNARNFTYLTKHDVTKTLSPLLPTLQASALSLLPTPRLTPSCVTETHAEPAVGKETKTATVTIGVTCTAFSYSVTSVAHAITTYSKRFGTGTLTHMQVFVVGVTHKVVSLYVVGQWRPHSVRRYWTGK